MVDVLVLALASALYPTLLAIVVIVLTRPRPVPLLTAFLAGGMFMSVAIGLAAISLLEGSGLLEGGSGRTFGPGIDLVAGVLSLALAALLAGGRELPFAARREALRERRNDPDRREPWSTRVLGRDSIVLAFTLGVVLNVPGIWYLVALKEIAQSGNGFVVDAVQVVIFNAIMFALIEVPLAGYLLSPQRSAERVARFQGAIHRNARRIAAAVATLAGVYLIVHGIAALG